MSFKSYSQEKNHKLFGRYISFTYLSGMLKKGHKRRHKLISKNKLVTAIKLFEKHVDASIDSIEMVSPNVKLIKTYGKGDYEVNISNNSVKRVYPDPEW